MSKLIQMPCNNGVIIVEVETTEDEIVPVSKTGELIVKEVGKSFESIENILVDSCSIMLNAIKKVASKEPTLEKAAVEFGFQLNGEGNIYLVKTAAKGSIKVTLNLILKQ